MTEKEIVNLFLNDKGFQQIVENEIGKPVKCTVNWKTRKILIQSPKSGRELNIDYIIDSYENGGGYQ